MIDIRGKPATDREAIARGRICMSRPAIEALTSGKLPKGDALAAARVAGILAAKRTPDLIPLCHPIPLSHIGIEFRLFPDRGEVEIEATARAHAPTGVEMEALTAVAVAALTIHDMCKALDPAAEISHIHLVRKSGGKSGPWERPGLRCNASQQSKGKLTAVCSGKEPGTRKTPIAVGVLRKDHGLVGDAHAGTNRQVSLLAEESIAKMRSSGLSLGSGDFAENLTTLGIALHTLALGTRLRVGPDALLEITQIGKTCHSDCDIRRLTGDCIMPTEGVFARVLVGGEVRAGDAVEVLQGEGCHSDSE